MSDRIVIAASARRPAIVEVIRSARRRLLVSMFRCTDSAILDELAAARARGVAVEALITPRARGWRKKLKDLGAVLESMGVAVHRYPVSGVKYHAKYVVADDGPALVGSLNFTGKCFARTSDFMLISHDPELASDLVRLFDADCGGRSWRANGSRLIVAPEDARPRLEDLIRQAKRSLVVVDHKATDKSMLGLITGKRDAGVATSIVGRGAIAGLVAHGKLMLIDGALAVIGSLSLKAKSLDRRRELAVVIRDRACVEALNSFVAAGMAVPLEMVA